MPKSTQKPTQTLRLNAALARLGVASRRKADELITQGRVRVNGKVVTQLGTRIDPFRQEVAVDGIPVDPPRKKNSYFALYKPRGVITTLSDPEGRKTVAAYLPKGVRVFPVGRLDYDAEGLLLFTNDGDLAHHLMHPKFGAQRTYLVKVKGVPSAETFAKLKKGVKLEDGFFRPVDARFEKRARSNTWFRMTVDEGRNRLLKRLWLRLEHPIQRLVRIEYAGVKLGPLDTGRLRPLTPAEIEHLKGV